MRLGDGNDAGTSLLGGDMTASRKEYWADLIWDCDEMLKDFEGLDPECYEGEGRALIISALILSDAINGLRKSLLQTMNQKVPNDTRD
jgi:hypothetical protein